MKNSKSVSSEEELVQLRDEGKITEAEYEQLRKAMEKTREGQAESRVAGQEKSRRRRGGIAFGLMLLGIIGPFLFWVALQLLVRPEENVGLNLGVLLLPAFALEVAAFAVGIAAWPDVFAKAAVVASGVIVVVLVLSFGG